MHPGCTRAHGCVCACAPHSKDAHALAKAGPQLDVLVQPELVLACCCDGRLPHRVRRAGEERSHRRGAGRQLHLRGRGKPIEWERKGWRSMVDGPLMHVRLSIRCGCVRHLLGELEPLGLHVGGGPRGHQRRDGARRHHRTRGARRRMKGGAGGEQREHAGRVASPDPRRVGACLSLSPLHSKLFACVGTKGIVPTATLCNTVCESRARSTPTTTITRNQIVLYPISGLCPRFPSPDSPSTWNSGRRQ